MRASTFAALAACAMVASAAPLKEQSDVQKRGGYYNSQGQWIDDGYWAATDGETKPAPAGWQPWGGNGTPAAAIAAGYQANYGSSSSSSSSSNSGSSNNSGSSSSSSGSSAGGQQYSGTATYYYQNGNPGACGNYNSDSAFIVALDSAAYGGGSHCGQSVKVCNSNTGSCQTAVVADECPTCCGFGCMDLSSGLFNALAPSADGTFPLSWSFE